MKHLLLSLLICCTSISNAQTLQLLDSNKNTSIRGMSVVNDKIVWLSGSKGTVALSVDGGKSFQWMMVTGYEKRDFRDVEAFDAKTAIIMAVDTPAVILKTTDGGNTWKKVFEDKRPGMFLDAMEFWNEMSGIAVGDPIDGKIFIARTFDGGNTWRGLPDAYYPIAENGEAMFASSGTNVTKLNKQEAVFVTGGKKSRMFIRNAKIDLPIIQGEDFTGANSIAVYDEQHIIIVGGDFTKDTSRKMNCVLTKDKGKTFITPATPPHGYRSCVAYISKNKLITCGTSGVDVSEDGGMNWRNISRESFHVVQKAKNGKAVFLAGARGRVAVLVW
ncbi:MAG: oxidoreductase [Chitinophagaceae bacterium]|nr:oxidoreductase [Chitinophagaceae bacterium]